MASITRDGATIIIQQDNTTQPVNIVDWANYILTYQEPDIIKLTIGTQSFRFGPWEITPSGLLTEVNGVDVSAETAEYISDLLESDVLFVYDPADTVDVQVNGVHLANASPGSTKDVIVKNTAATPVGAIAAGEVEVADAAITINGDAFTTTPAEVDVEIPVIDTNTDPVGSKVGSDWVVPAA